MPEAENAVDAHDIMAPQPRLASPSPSPRAVVTVAVVDDHSLMRSVYRTLLEDVAHLDLAWTAGTAEEARARFAEKPAPDLVIMDLKLPDGCGYELTREFLQVHPDVAVLVVSAYEEQACALAARDSGARGYLVKDCTPDELLQALGTVQRGLSYFRPSVVIDA